MVSPPYGFSYLITSYNNKYSIRVLKNIQIHIWKQIQLCDTTAMGRVILSATKRSETSFIKIISRFLLYWCSVSEFSSLNESYTVPSDLFKRILSKNLTTYYMLQVYLPFNSLLMCRLIQIPYHFNNYCVNSQLFKSK